MQRERATTMTILGGACGAALVLALALAPDALAAFPGENGRIAFASTRDANYEIYTMEATGNGIARLTNVPAADQQPAWSPDGTKIAFVSVRPGNFELYVMNADGSGVVRLTDNGSKESFPAWSPDGAKLVFASDDPETGADDLWIVEIESGDLTRLTSGPGSNSQPAWSHDGSTIAFVSDRGGSFGVFRLDVGSLEVAPLVDDDEAEETAPDWSPDGSRIVYQRNDAGTEALWWVGADGQGAEPVPGTVVDDGEPVFSPDGAWLAFRGQKESSYGVFVMRIDGSERNLLTGDAIGDDIRPDWQPIPTEVENEPPVADAGDGGTFECASPEGAVVVLDGTGSYDPDGDPITFLWSAPGISFDDPTSPTPAATFPLGSTVVTLVVNDSHLSSEPATVVVTVVDTIPPTIEVIPVPSVLWPPNHKLVPVHAVVRVADACTPAPVPFALVSATSSEPDDAQGGGDGSTIHDIQSADIGLPDVDLLLRAERQGGGPGRTYTLAYTATDGAGLTTGAEARVIVPHDQGQAPGSEQRGSAPGPQDRSKSTKRGQGASRGR